MERTTPHNLEAEQAVLGSVFVEEGSIKTLVDKLEPEDFYKYQHKVIFRAMKDLFTDNVVIDYTTLTSKLETKGMLNDAGGIDYILGLINNVPSIANLVNYINIVKDKSITRRIMEACRKIIDDGFVAEDAIEFVDQSEKVIFDIAKERRTADFVSIQQVTEEVILKTEAAKDRAGELTGLDTKFDELNRYTNGLQPSELVIIAARPSMGKSAFALNIATNVAKMKEHPYVAFFSLEMGSDQLVGRMLSAESKVHSTKIRTGHLDRMEWRQLNLAQETLSKLNILFDDAGTVKVTDLRQKCRKLAQEKRLDLVIIDYLQLLSGSRNDVNRVNEVSEISRTLKEMARELKIPVIALSQLSRNVERRDSQIPVMADLRDSGSIEQDADIVMFLYREDYYKKDTENKNEVDIIIAKNRQGATTSEPIKLAFNKSCSYFANRAVGPSNSALGDVEI
jgi:replicative DNA helicase